MKRAVPLAVAVAVGLALVAKAAEEGKRTVLSRSFTVDKLYKSMQGPVGSGGLTLLRGTSDPGIKSAGFVRGGNRSIVEVPALTLRCFSNPQLLRVDLGRPV